MAEATLNLPQLLAVVVVGFLAIRWFFSSVSASASASTSASGAPGGASSRQINPAHVDQVAAMFPQLDRRSIMWDLHRNGGSVQATIERVLGGRGLDVKPPVSFQPPTPSPIPSSTSASAAPAPKNVHPDLITRYNLSSKIASPPPQDGMSSSVETKTKQVWSANKNERSEQLKRRREEMILAARRKMEEKERATSAAS
ncbi:hypothetical protein LTR28_008253 [Elasticomyces elasticus]|nr:hypothetical protein LTR28_008253 [Elasticomyces elasticus]